VNKANFVKLIVTPVNSHPSYWPIALLVILSAESIQHHASTTYQNNYDFSKFSKSSLVATLAARQLIIIIIIIIIHIIIIIIIIINKRSASARSVCQVQLDRPLQANRHSTMEQS
jgi:cytosine/uracil/thiamine/allantoin permease